MAKPRRLVACQRTEYRQCRLVLVGPRHPRILRRYLEREAAGAQMTDWRASDPDIAAIVGARHADPFSILGPHRTPNGTAIRAFVPGAAALYAVDPAGAAIAQLQPRHSDGFFEALVPDRPTLAASA